MRYRLEDAGDESIMSIVFDVLDSKFHGAIKNQLDDATFYLITGRGDSMGLEAVKHLMEENSPHLADLFIDSIQQKSTIGVGISDKDNKIKSILLNIDLRKTDDETEIPIEEVVSRIIKVLEEVKVIKPQTVEELRYIIRDVVNEIGAKMDSKIICEHVPRSIYM